MTNENKFEQTPFRFSMQHTWHNAFSIVLEFYHEVFILPDI